MGKKKKPSRKGNAAKKKHNLRKRVASRKSVPIKLLPSMLEMETLLASSTREARKRERARTAVDEAQEVMYEAWQAPTLEIGMDLALRALEISLDCADAYNFFAERVAESAEEALELYRYGVEAGKRALGETAFTDYAGRFWGILETRPYMRARSGLAEMLWKLGRHDEAIEHYWALLKLNPMDNQGIRYLLMPCLVELGRDQEARKLFKLYEKDCLAAWAYSRTLLDFREYGDSPAPDKSLKVAVSRNRYVPLYLLGRKKMPRSHPSHFSIGDANEAVDYVWDNKAAWEASPGALEWLAVKIEPGREGSAAGREPDFG